MKILQVHNYYQQSGGEDVVVAAERELLQAHGHEVRFYGVSNDSVNGVIKKIQTAWKTPYSNSARLLFTAELASHKPDIVHVHNLFPLITPSVYDACHDANIPVVQTLHNFRLICPGALLMRAGKICAKCLDYSPYYSVLYGCYRTSRLGTLAVARMVSIHKKLGTWHTKVDRFIALTKFAKSKFIAAGFPTDKIVVKPNFVRLNDIPIASGKRNGALFVGRLSQEKGITTLLDAWRNINHSLRIIGEGPLFDEAQKQHRENVDFLGRRASSDVLDTMTSSQFFVMPSLWYEGFPMVIVEAFACGLPVIVSRLGSMAEIVEDGVTGLHFTPGDTDDLAAKVRWAFEHPEEMHRMGENARKACQEKYSAELNYQQLMSIYESTISTHKGRHRQ